MRKLFLAILILLSYIGNSQPMRMLLAKKASASVTYATWDGTLKGSNTTLSGSNLVATMVTSQSVAMATIGGSTTGKSTGKWYWEITLTSNGGAPSFGVMSGTSCNLNTHVGACSNGYAYYYLLGGWWHATTLDFNVFSCGTLAAGDIIGIALDAGGNTITFYKNGTLCTPSAQTISGGNYFPAVSSNVSTFTANFGASAFTYSVPSGYNSGYY